VLRATVLGDIWLVGTRELVGGNVAGFYGDGAALLAGCAFGANRDAVADGKLQCAAIEHCELCPLPIGFALRTFGMAALEKNGTPIRGTHGEGGLEEPALVGVTFYRGLLVDEKERYQPAAVVTLPCAPANHHCGLFYDRHSRFDIA